MFVLTEPARRRRAASQLFRRRRRRLVRDIGDAHTDTQGDSEREKYRLHVCDGCVRVWPLRVV